MCVLMCVLAVAPFVAFPQTMHVYVSTLSIIESTLTLRSSIVVLVAILCYAFSIQLAIVITNSIAWWWFVDEDFPV